MQTAFEHKQSSAAIRLKTIPVSTESLRFSKGSQSRSDTTVGVLLHLSLIKGSREHNAVSRGF